MVRTFASMAACSAMALLAPADDGAGAIDPAGTSPPEIEDSGEGAPADNERASGVRRRPKRAHVVWVAPGYEAPLRVGAVLRIPAEQVDDLRASGKARAAQPAEIDAAGDAVVELEQI
ncbi:MAG: hypothetical protein IIZ63_10055 [Caulobacteraceae bacterium]|nr:hypothetical protein [Caulobacteraceae bacterium]